ncbi:MAG: hypothetical protein IJO90_00285, partial [Alistipes sp.]|nr:hypothetical protein [Alistipes sp.]
MKKYIFISVLAIFCALSCTNGGVDNGGDAPTRITSVEASLESTTRASMAVSSTLLQPKWSSGDKLCVTDLAAKTSFNLRA